MNDFGVFVGYSTALSANGFRFASGWAVLVRTTRSVPALGFQQMVEGFEKSSR